MTSKDLAPTHHDVNVSTSLGDTTVHYVSAGDQSKPVFLLLHGFPSSSTQYRDFIPLLSSQYHVIAPDLPGFGLTKVPSDFVFTFVNLTIVIAAWLKKLHVSSYAVYLFDYGGPVGFRLALENPSAVKAMVSQNGNAYDVGFGQDFWAPIFNLWNTSNSAEAREVLRENVLTQATTTYQYYAGVPERDQPLIDPEQPIRDYLQNIAGTENQEHQLDLFYDYRTNPTAYPAWHEYLRTSQVPLLAVWGKGDPAFIPPGAEAFKNDSKNVQVHLLDTGHFALETKRWEIAQLVKEFLGKIKF